MHLKIIGVLYIDCYKSFTHQLLQKSIITISKYLALTLSENKKFILLGKQMNAFLRLTLKAPAPITTTADDIHKYFFIVIQRK